MSSILRELLVRLKGDSKSLEAAMTRADKAMNKTRATTQKASASVQKSFFTMENAAKGLAAAYAAIGVINISDEYTLLTARVRSASESQEEFNKSFEELRNIAKATGTELGSAVEVFQRLSFSRKEIGATANEMLAFTDTVSKLGAMSGTSTQNLNAGLRQLGQGLSSGVFRAEEFNSVLENIPAVANKIADTLGVTTGELRNLVLDGNLLSEEVFKAILLSSKQVNAEFSKFPKTFSRAFNDLKQEAKEFTAEITKVSGSANAFVDALEGAKALLQDMKPLAIAIADAFGDFTNTRDNERIADIQERLSSIKERMKELREFPRGKGITAGIIGDINESARLSEQNLLAKEARALNSELVFLQKTQKANKDTTDLYTEATKESKEEVKELQEAIEAKLEAMAKESDSEKLSTEEKKKAKEALKALKKEQDRNNKALIAYKDHLRDTKNEGIDLFVDSLARGENALQSFRNTALSTLQDVLKNMLKLQLGGDAGGGLAGSIASSLMSGFGSAGSSNPYRGVDFQAFATGGSFTVGGTGGTDSQLVAFKASPNERVSIETPSQQQKRNSGGGGIVIHQNLNVSTGVQQTVAAEMQRMLPAIRQQSVSAVEEAQNRGRLK